MSISSSLISISHYKNNIKNSIENKLNNGVDIGFDLSLYPNYIRQIKELSAQTIQSFTGSTVIDKCNYIQYLKGEMASAIQECGVSNFNPDNLSEYSTAINRIKVHYDFEIQGPSVMSGESFSLVSVFDNIYDVTTASTWSITNGNQYATISGGAVTILSGANDSNITVEATYCGNTATHIVEVTYLSGTSAETETTTTTDESGNTTTTTTTVITNEDGSSSSQSTSINYDALGNEIGSSENETVVNADGSSESTTINYDENGDPTSQVNENIDTLGNEDTKNIEYNESGEPVVVSYTIDTSNNQTTGTQPISGGTGGVDTDFIPFDGSNGFEMIIKFKAIQENQPNPPVVVDTEDTSNNYLFNIMCAKSPNSPWPGIDIRWGIPKTDYTSTSATLRARYQPGSGSKTEADIKTRYNNSTDKIHYIKFVYDPSLSTKRMKIVNM